MWSNNYQRSLLNFAILIVITILVVSVVQSTARPVLEHEIGSSNSGTKSHLQQHLRIREKRSGISDQRLAELETLLALKRLRDQHQRTRTPVAWGVIDPAKIGRRRKRANARRHYQNNLYRLNDQERDDGVDNFMKGDDGNQSQLSRVENHDDRAEVGFNDFNGEYQF